MKFSRATMYTPAVTIVAAWISALTGVGPAMASGSHTYKGSCADFPIAPTKSSVPINATRLIPNTFLWMNASRKAGSESLSLTRRKVRPAVCAGTAGACC